MEITLSFDKLKLFTDTSNSATDAAKAQTPKVTNPGRASVWLRPRRQPHASSGSILPESVSLVKKLPPVLLRIKSNWQVNCDKDIIWVGSVFPERAWRKVLKLIGTCKYFFICKVNKNYHFSSVPFFCDILSLSFCFYLNELYFRQVRDFFFLSFVKFYNH